MDNVPKSNEKNRPYSLTLPPMVSEKFEKMKDYYGLKTSALIIVMTNELFGGRFRKETLGYQGGYSASDRKLQTDIKKQNNEALIKELEAITDPILFHMKLIEIGYYEAEEVLPDYTIENTIVAEGNTLRHMMKTDNSLSTGPTKEEIIDKLSKKL